MFERVKDVLTWLPILGPYFDFVFSGPKQTVHSSMDQVPVRIVSDSDRESPRTHADWASEQIAAPLKGTQQTLSLLGELNK